MSDPGWCPRCSVWHDDSDGRCPLCGMILASKQPTPAPVAVETMVSGVLMVNPKKPNAEPGIAKTGGSWVWACSCKETATADSKGSAVSSLGEHRLACVDCQ